MAINGTKEGIRKTLEVVLDKLKKEGINNVYLTEAILIGGFEEGLYNHFLQQKNNWSNKKKEGYIFYNQILEDLFNKYFV